MPLRCDLVLLGWCTAFLLVGVASAQRGSKWYVSHSGTDYKNCGFNYATACKTLLYTVGRAGNRDIIYLDGQGSKDDPYGCKIPTALQERTGGGFISKSLSVIGLYTRAYLSCDHGLHFRSPPSQKLNVTLNYLTFVGKGTNFTGDCNVFIFNCTFLKCFSPLNLTGTILTLVLEMSVFENNTNCMNINQPAKRNGFVSIEILGVVFKNNSIQSKDKNGMVFVNNAHGNTVIRIRNTLFQDNYSRRPAYVINVKSDKKKAGSLQILNSSFVSTSNGVLVNGYLNMNFSNLTFVSNERALWLILNSSNTESSLVTLEDSLFSNNRASFFLQLSLRKAKVTVQIKNCLFNESVHQEGTQLPAVEFQDKSDNYQPCSDVSYEILITNVSFRSIRGGALFLSDFTRERKLNIKIEDSLFINNENTYFYARTGYIVYMMVNGEDKYPCQSSKMAGQVQFRNTHFTGNNASIGIVFLSYVDARFDDCNFTKNYFLSAEGALIDHGEGRGNLTIRNVKFLQPKNPPKNMTSKMKTNRWPIFISSINKGNLVVEESSFVAIETYSFYPVITATKSDSVYLDSFTTIQCPVNTVFNFIHWRRPQDILGNSEHCTKNVTTLKIFCNSCPLKTYSLLHGRSAGLKTNQSECHPCPYGATCLDGIKAKPNFWGYEKRPSILAFVPCPLEYCHPHTSSNVSSYNGCYGNRTGTLCGACKDEYSEEMFSTRCRVQSECQDHWFWVFTASYSVALVLFLMFRQRLLSFLWRQTFWYRRPASEAIQLRHFDEGYLKITFYFYQIAELLVLEGPEHLLSKVNILSAWFNLFDFELQYFSEDVGCPFPGLTAVTKELFKCSRVFTTMACSVVTFFTHKIIANMCGLKKPSLTFYLAVLMEILLLGYERLADTALSLLHCVPIGSEWRLFLDGNKQCWQWWQIGLMAYIVVFVAPFIMVLYFGSLSLYRNKVSAKEFLGACALPLPFLVRWAVQHVRGNNTMQQDSSNGEEIKETLYEPFRTPTEEDNGTVYWESVLIGRRFLLLCLHSFIADPMFRLMSLDCACVLILLHHVFKRPYRNTSANVCETVSLLALVAIATFNLAEAVLMSAGVEAAGPNEVGLEALEWVEVALLGFLPVALCVLGTFAFFSQLCRLTTAMIRGSQKVLGIREYSGFSYAEQKRPLLYPTSSGYS